MKRFINENQLEMHKRYHSNHENYSKSAISPSAVKQRLEKRKSPKPHICDFCDKLFYSPRKLEHHIDRDHGINLDENKPKKAKTMKTRKDATEENSIDNELTIEESQLDKSLIAPKLEPEVLESETFKDEKDVDKLPKENEEESEEGLNNDFDGFADEVNGVDETNDDNNDEVGKIYLFIEINICKILPLKYMSTKSVLYISSTLPPLLDVLSLCFDITIQKI